jgi:arabinogalactan oligomer/maltooligosaccharide transport system permease protein
MSNTATQAPVKSSLEDRPSAPQRKSGGLRRSWDRYWYAWAMVIPVALVLGGLVLFPLLRGIWLSFTDITEANQIKEICRKTLAGGQTCSKNPNSWRMVGLQNYVNVLTG